VLKQIFNSAVGKLKQIFTDKPINSVELDQKLLKDVKQKKFPSWEQLKNFKKVLSTSEKKLFNFSVLLLLISVGWLGVNWSSAYSHIEGKVGSPPQLINPLFAGLNSTDEDLASLVYSGLMRYDDGKLKTDLAADYQVKNNGKTYIYELKKGVEWHDEEQFTADDVVYTFNKLKDKQVNSPLYVTFRGISVKKQDKYKVKFELNKPYSFFPHSLTVGVLPEHIWSGISPSKMTLTKKNLQPVGTGPYKFKKLAKDNTGYIYEYVLTRNENFYRRPPYLKEFVLKFYRSYQGSNGVVQALKEQAIDGLSYLPPREKQQTQLDSVNFYELELPQYTALFFNQTESEALSNKTTRTALGHAIDKKRVLSEAIFGEGKVVNSPVLSGYPGSNSETNQLSYQVEQANKLLDKNWTRIKDQEYKDLRLDKLINQFGLVGSASTSTINSFYSEDDPNLDPTYTGKKDANYSRSVVVNDYAEDTESREVTLKISGNDIEKVALSNDTDFSNSSFKDYQSELSWKLTPGNGEKWVFAKIKTSDGEEQIVYDKIKLINQFLDEKRYIENEISPKADEINQVQQVLEEETSGPQTFYRKNKDEEILELEITTLDKSEYRRAAKLVVNLLEEVGVKAEVRYVSDKEMNNQVLKQKNYDILLYRLILGGEPDQYPFWHSSQKKYPGLNLSNFENDEIDKLLEQARKTRDDKKIAEIYRKINKIILKQHPAIFLYQPNYTYLQSDKIKGFDTKRIFSPSGRLKNIRDWYTSTKNEWNFSN
jgi:ABC-type transport system substrate-binding protein